MYHSIFSQDGYALTNPGGNVTGSSYPSRAPTTVRPDLVTSGVVSQGDGVIACGHIGAETLPHLILVPFGVGTSSNTFLMTVLGWRPTKLGVLGALPVWIPAVLGTYQITLGSATGVSGGEITTSSLFNTSDSVTLGPSFVSGVSPVSLDWLAMSPGSNSIGFIKQPTMGFRFVEVIFSTGSSATSCNCLWAKA